MKGAWKQCLALLVLLLLHLVQIDARVQAARQHRRIGGQSLRAAQTSTLQSGTGGEGSLQRAAGERRRRRAVRREMAAADTMQDGMEQKALRRRRAAGEKIALAAAEEGAEAKPKGTKKKKKKGTGKKKMTKEEAIAAAQEAQAAAAAALLKGISHEDAAKAAEATLQEKGAGELTKGVLGAEDVEKAEGRPAPFRKKGEKADAEPGAAAAAAESDKPKEVGNAKDDVAKAEAKETEPASAAADATAAPKKKKKKKKKAAAATEKAVTGAASSSEEAGTEKAEDAEKAGDPEKAVEEEKAVEADLKSDANNSAAASEKPQDAQKPAAPAKKKKKKKSKKKAAEADSASEVSERKLQTLESNSTEGALLSQLGADEDAVEGDGEGEDGEEVDEGIELELGVTGVTETLDFPAAPEDAAPSPVDSALLLPAVETSLSVAESAPEQTEQAEPQLQPSVSDAMTAAAAAAANASSGAEAKSDAGSTPASGRPALELPPKKEVSTDVISQLLKASASAVRREAAALQSRLMSTRRQSARPAAEQASPAVPHREPIQHKQESKATAGVSEAEPSPPATKVKVEEEAPPLREVKELPPWFKDSAEGKERAAKLGSGQRHKQRQMGPDEKWLRVHQRHLHEVRELWDVILYGDDIVEAWRGTFVGMKYGPFNDIPAVWDQYFGSKPYKTLAAGIAGDGAEQLLWRLQNGELPPVVAPQVVVIACGTNSKGMTGECAVPAATEAAEEMARLVRHVREALPTARIVLQAPLPKGDYWPNRCTPAFELFNGRLQELAAEDPSYVHFVDYGEAFLALHASNAWQTNTTAPLKKEINEAYMPDALHPSAAGMRIIADRLEPLISKLVSEADSAAQAS